MSGCGTIFTVRSPFRYETRALWSRLVPVGFYSHTFCCSIWSQKHKPSNHVSLDAYCLYTTSVCLDSNLHRDGVSGSKSWAPEVYMCRYENTSPPMKQRIMLPHGAGSITHRSDLTQDLTASSPHVRSDSSKILIPSLHRPELYWNMSPSFDPIPSLVYSLSRYFSVCSTIASLHCDPSCCHYSSAPAFARLTPFLLRFHPWTALTLSRTNALHPRRHPQSSPYPSPVSLSFPSLMSFRVCRHHSGLSESLAPSRAPGSSSLNILSNSASVLPRASAFHCGLVRS